MVHLTEKGLLYIPTITDFHGHLFPYPNILVPIPIQDTIPLLFARYLATQARTHTAIS